MVFTQYRYNNDGSFEELSIKIIDTGVGLQRIPWLINGSPTSYYDVFSKSFEFLTKKIDIPLYNEIWEKVGPYTCKLNIDEIDSIDQTWK